jgi:hypothetical protein
MASLRGHYSLEHTAQHVRRYPTVALTLHHREVKPLKELVKRVSPESIRDIGPEASFQRVRLEQAPVEEWNGAE